MPRASLFELETVVEDPANLNSADADYVVTASDSMDYVVKTRRRHPLTPASEWICHRLAEACGIPTPQYAIIRMRDGQTGFGSQWDASIVMNQKIINSVVTAIPGAPLLARIFTAIFIVDLFVHNEDRHIGNYFFVRTRNGIGVKVFDFSRALFYHSAFPLPSLPMGVHTNTVTCARALRVAYSISKPVVQETVRLISGISVFKMTDWLDDMPGDWITAAVKAEFLKWWRSQARTRASDIEKGINDGTLL